eukprot:gnl/TRDRNA2_/TRDRNA2_177073_c2_seq15.p1 gnl/TRDRNA2_/TRDRNA2_177073_c2~~gnl/TRDRNA2_/TRDRNA2_177073_c2_seq15.p1  ORF type:complete len:368 (-),score=36.22 gnl/TRDRNA2_/TRDRNA2_177073_c2_seq15:234-1337(-)
MRRCSRIRSNGNMISLSILMSCLPFCTSRMFTLHFGKSSKFSGQPGIWAKERIVKNFRAYGLKFSHGRPSMKNGKYDKKTSDHYLMLQNLGCSGARCSEVVGCDFRRGSQHQGRGMGEIGSENVLIQGNICGGEDVELDGYFTTCLISKGVNTRVTHNVFRRILGTDGATQDHGIYAKKGYNLTIANNLVAGWMCSNSGGAIKLSDFTGATVQDNILAVSGLLVVDDGFPTTDILFMDNILAIDVTNRDKDKVPKVMRGVGIYLDKKDSKNNALPTSGESISITDNTIYGKMSEVVIHKKAQKAILKPSERIGETGGVNGNKICTDKFTECLKRQKSPGWSEIWSSKPIGCLEAIPRNVPDCEGSLN